MNTRDFKWDLLEVLEKYDEIDDERLRNAAYQVIDYYGDDNLLNESNWK